VFIGFLDFCLELYRIYLNFLLSIQPTAKLCIVSRTMKDKRTQEMNTTVDIANEMVKVEPDVVARLTENGGKLQKSAKFKKAGGGNLAATSATSGKRLASASKSRPTTAKSLAKTPKKVSAKSKSAAASKRPKSSLRGQTPKKN
jgi:hypothetical protein